MNIDVRPADALLEAALAYAARGWRIFPCDPNPKKPWAKRPLVGTDKDADGKAIEGSGWPKKASCDPDQIRAWWRRWPKALIGMAPGWAGAFVVDLDPKGEPVDAVEARLAEAIGHPLPAGPRTITQSGGRHLWFRRPDREVVGNDTPGLANIDIRCDHGYVIVPPSVMGNGNTYTWEELPFDGEAPDVPPALLDLIDRRGRQEAAPKLQARPAAAPPAIPREAGEEARRRYARGALDRIRTEVASTGAKRGTAVFGGACAAGRFVFHGALSEREAIAALLDAAEINGLVGTDGAASVERDIARGLEEGRRDAEEVGKRLDEVAREAEENAKRRDRWARPVDDRSEPPPWEPDDEIPSFEGNTPDPQDDFEATIGDPPIDGGEPDWGLVEACAPLDQSDTDNGKRLMIHRGRDLKVRDQQGGKEPLWCVWSGRHWADTGGRGPAKAIAQTIGDLIKLEAIHILPTPPEREAIGERAQAKEAWASRGGDPMPAESEAIARGDVAEKAVETRKGKRISFGVSSKNKARVEAMLDMAAPHLVLPTEAFNHDPLLVATETHTLRFVREKLDGCSDASVRVVATEGHDRDDLVTTLVPVRWDEAARGARWRAFIERFMPNRHIRRFLQKVCGLGLLGITEQIFVYHHGSGANGKSVFLEAIARTLGPLAAGLPAGAIAGEDASDEVKATPEIARLYASRFVRVAEIDENASIRESALKRYTGGEKFPARNLFEGFFEFKPIFVLHGSGNGYPRIVGVDNGIWRRVRVIRWPVQLSESEMRNFEDVVGELMEDREAILAWLVEGARLYLEEGLQTPDEVLVETAKFREFNDPVAEFLDQAIDATGEIGDEVAAADLYKGFTAFAEGSRTAVNQTRFGLNLKAALKFEEDASTKTARGAVTRWVGSLRGKRIEKDSSSGRIVYRGMCLRSRSTSGWTGDPGWQPSADH